MSQNLAHYTDIAEHLLKRAKQIQADHVEVHIQGGQAARMSARQGAFETLEFETTAHLSLTVYKDQAQGVASTNVLQPQALEDCVEQALAIARYSEKDAFLGLAPKADMAFEYQDPGIDFSESLPNLDTMRDIALELDDLSQMVSTKQIKDVRSEGSDISTHQGFQVYGNSHGMIGSYSGSSASCSIGVLGQNAQGMEQAYWFDRVRNWPDMPSIELFQSQAIERVQRKLSAEPLGSQKAQVIFSPDIAKRLFSPLFGALSGRSQYLKNGFLVESLGQSILPDWLTISHDPLISGGLYSLPFDADGVKTRPLTLIQSGIVEQYVLGDYSARRLGMTVNGCASGLRNVRLAHPTLSLDAMLKDAGKGVYITELMGQGVNTMTGDMSQAAAGIWFEDGQLRHGVKNFTLAGNLKDLYANMLGIADDTDTRGNLHCGSLWVGPMTLAGMAGELE